MAEHVWRWFLEISRRRSGGGFGANPISYAEVEAWVRLTCTMPSALEVEWLMDLDDTRAAAAAAASSAPRPKKTK